MSRTLSAGYLAHLGQTVQQRALCIKVTRQDAEVFAFTSFDTNLVFDSVTYEAAFAVEVSDIRQSAGAGTDNAEALGALVSSRITDTDVLAGLWDGAAFELFEVCWDNLPLGRMIWLNGTLGEFTLETGRYRTELRGLAQHLSQSIVELSQATCRVAQLFDERCFVGGENYDETFVPGDFRSNHAVTAVTSLTEITFGSNAQASTYYRAGRVEFLTGLNAGLQRPVKEHTLVGGEAVITLQESFPFVVAVADSAMLEAGCDRRGETCRDRFANKGNFRGEDFLPGGDAIMVRGRR